MIPKVIKFGKIIKAHGVDGEILIEINQQFEDIDIQPNFLFIDIDGGLVPFQVVTQRFKNYKETLVYLDTINSEPQATQLNNSYVFVNVDEIDEKTLETTIIHDLDNFEVFDLNHGFIGKVVSIIEINNNPLLEVIYDNKEILIPYHQEIIIEIDENKKSIKIDAPEGLIELYLE